MINNIPNGKWVVDPSHSSVEFTVKHLMISKVRGVFTEFTGTAITRDNDLMKTEAEGSVKTASVSTNDLNRDAHLRSADFFDSENYPEMKLVAQHVNPVGDNKFTVDALLTIRNVTAPIQVHTVFGGITTDPYGNVKGAVEASFKIDRTMFGLNWNSMLETGGVLVGNDVNVVIDVQAVLETEETQ